MTSASFLLRHAALMACALMAAAPVRAEPDIDCGNAASTYEMNECAGRDYEKVDAELNRVYKAALAAIPEMAVDEPRFNAKSWEAALRASQRAWIAYRDAECDEHVPMSWSGGTGTTVAVISCKTGLTEERTKALREHYEIK